MNKKHAIEYPDMFHGIVSLRLATNSIEMDKLTEELANDMEARANLSVSDFNFKTDCNGTWNNENWLIRIRDNVAGYVTIYKDRENDTARLAIAVKRDYRDKGVAIKAVALILRYMFDVLYLQKIETSCYGFNLRSQKIYSSFLTPEGVLRESVVWAGKRWDKHLYGLTRSEWDKRRGKVDKLLIKKQSK